MSAPGGACPHGAAPGAPDGPGALPPVRDWPATDLPGTDFDPVLSELMREGPVTRIRLPHGSGWAWLVTRHADVRAVTNDPRFSRRAVLEQDVTRLAPHFIPVPGAIGFEDPPGHTRLRRVVAPAFTAPGVERLRGRAQEMLDDLVNAVLREGPPADLTAAVLAPFPLAVVSELMGVPPADRPRMHHWTELILSSAHGAERSARARQEMCDHFTALLRRRIAGGSPAGGGQGPGSRAGNGGSAADGSVTGLLAAGVADGQLTEAEAAGLALLLQIGGEAVTNNSGNILYLLLTRPDLWERLREEPESRPSAVEELLRYIPHRNAVGLSRIALEDVTVAGARIRAGEPVYVSYLAANRDPEVFPDPGRIDPGRSPNPHVAFGHGPHYCVGALLARMESELLLDAWLDRFPGLRFAVPTGQLRWRPGALIRGPESLPVTW
ncbi:cytochrome P450 [Streptomyces zingiberis]|uniref:Cytochrome P450 n=1 Tax=Streptomyces zingiberis TaxID=2053010 RepID=A0ABX1BWZ4_9ACTN|nr:cytochrome P450 [Streptomyces zingiberis]NJQ00400.1 cytochrome P450 [Streptomyces zingiberis]